MNVQFGICSPFAQRPEVFWLALAVSARAVLSQSAFVLEKEAWALNSLSHRTLGVAHVLTGANTSSELARVERRRFRTGTVSILERARSSHV